MRVTGLLFALILSFWPGCRGADPVGHSARNTLPELDKKITIARTGTLAEFLEDLEKGLGLNIVLDPRIADEEAVRIPREIILRDVKGVSALRWMTWLFGVTFILRENVVFVTVDGDSGPLVQRVYDVRPLLATGPTRPDVRASIPEGGLIGFGVSYDETREATVGEDRLIDLVRSFIHPGTWEGNRTLELVPGGSLLVTCEERHHRKIEDFLETLKSLAPPSVTVSARIFEVEKTAELIPFGPLSPEALAAFEREYPPADDITLRVVGALGLDSLSHFMEQETIVIDYEGKGSPVVGTFVTDVAILKILPTPRPGMNGLFLEMELILGRTRFHDPPHKERLPDLKCPEGSLAQLRAIVPLRKGGGALLGLPRASADSKRLTVCLLKASTDAPLPHRPRTIELGAPPPPHDLLRRLTTIRVPEVRFQNTRLSDAAAFLRRQTGVNVLVRDENRNFPVTLSLRDVSLSEILSFMARPDKFETVVRDEAVYIGIPDPRLEDRYVMLADVRDLVFPPEDFDRPGIEKAVVAFTGEDIASLMMNTVARDSWEEADGNSLAYEDGILFIRNTPKVISECKAFLARCRMDRPPVHWISATSLILPKTDVDRILRKEDGTTKPVGDKEIRALLGASRRTEHLAWPAVDAQRTYQQWQRYRSHVSDWEKKDDPVMDVATVTSWLQIRARALKDGRMALDERFRGESFREMKNVPVGEGLVLQSPVVTLQESSGSSGMPTSHPTYILWNVKPAADGIPLVRLLMLRARKAGP